MATNRAAVNPAPGTSCPKTTRLPGQGFALVLALFALVLVGALAAGGLLVAMRHSRAAEAGARGDAAFYAAEAGLIAALVGLDPEVADSLQPGNGIVVTDGVLISGDKYSARLSRWDAGHDTGAAYFLLESTGTAHGARGGRRRVATMLRKPPWRDFCCRAALDTDGAVKLDSGAVISGLDAVPSVWAATPNVCSGIEVEDRPGVLTDDVRLVQSTNAGIEGRPPVGLRDGADESRDTRGWLRELGTLADVRYSGGAVLAELAPFLWASGECGRSGASNWGAPTVPGHPCFTYFPVIHAEGDLTIQTPGSGQGVLLVDGDLEIGGGFEFYGVVLVGGRVRLGDGGSRVVGGVRSGALASDTVRVRDEGQILYSGCAVQRAVQGSKVQAPHPLAQFGWFEILE